MAVGERRPKGGEFGDAALVVLEGECRCGDETGVVDVLDEIEKDEEHDATAESAVAVDGSRGFFIGERASVARWRGCRLPLATAETVRSPLGAGDRRNAGASFRVPCSRAADIMSA